MKQLFPILLTIFIVITGVTVMSAVVQTSEPEPSEDKPTVAATIFPIYDIARNIAGDAIKVELVLPPGASPHTFDPTPSDVRALQHVTVLYTVGLGLDDWSRGIAESVGFEILSLDDSVVLQTTDGDDEHEEEAEHEHGEFDPHYWLSTQNAERIADAVLADLSARYPEHQADLETNHATYVQQLKELHGHLETQLTDLPSRNMVTFHNSFGYFAHEFDLNIIGAFEPTAGREPTAQELVQLTHLVEEQGVNVIYSEPQLSVAPLAAFLQDNNISATTLDPIGGTHDRASYIDLMHYNAETISQNQ